jgi:hypothetical protein
MLSILSSELNNNTLRHVNRFSVFNLVILKREFLILYILENLVLWKCQEIYVTANWSLVTWIRLRTGGVSGSFKCKRKHFFSWEYFGTMSFFSFGSDFSNFVAEFLCLSHVCNKETRSFFNVIDTVWSEFTGNRPLLIFELNRRRNDLPSGIKDFGFLAHGVA